MSDLQLNNSDSYILHQQPGWLLDLGRLQDWARGQLELQPGGDDGDQGDDGGDEERLGLKGRVQEMANTLAGYNKFMWIVLAAAIGSLLAVWVR